MTMMDRIQGRGEPLFLPGKETTHQKLDHVVLHAYIVE